MELIYSKFYFTNFITRRQHLTLLLVENGRLTILEMDTEIVDELINSSDSELAFGVQIQLPFKRPHQDFPSHNY